MTENVAGIPRCAAEQPMHTDSLESWNAILHAHFGQITAQSAGRRRFAAALWRKPIGEVAMIRCDSTPASVVNAPRKGPGTCDHGYVLKAQVSGSSVLSGSGQTIMMQPGDHVLCDGSRPYSLELAGHTTILSIPLPRKYLVRRSPFAEDLAFSLPGRSAPTRQLASSYLRALWSCDRTALSAAAQGVLVGNAMDLAILAIAEEAGGTAHGRSGKTAIFKRCWDYIDRHYLDASLTPSRVARANGISLRYLQAIFAERGLTVKNCLLERRLAEARKILQSPAHGDRTVGEIALAVGFRSLPSFSRSFKDHFAASPSRIRPGHN